MYYCVAWPSKKKFHLQPLYRRIMYHYLRRAVIFLYVTNIVLLQTVMTAGEEVPNTTLASLGNIAEMTCLFDSADSRFTLIWKSMEITLLSHSWQESNTKTDGRFTSSIESNGKTCRLLIENATFEDVGKYVCSKSYHVSGKPEKCSWNVDIQDGPNIVHVSTVHENQTTSAQCCMTSTAASNATFEWAIDSKIPNSRKTNINNILSAHLILSCSNVSFVAKRRHHNRLLNCSVQNQLSIWSTWQMKVMYPASVKWKPNEALSNYVIADRNDNVNVMCLSDGYPSPDVGIQSLSTNNDGIWRNLSFAGTVLNIEGGLKTWLYQVNIAGNQSVALRCANFNCHMPCTQGDEFLVVATYMATVRMTTPVKLKVDIGDNTTITCQTQGYPRPNIFIEKQIYLGKWVKLPVQPIHIEMTTDTDKQMTWQFHFTNIAKEHEGQYRCVANNTNDDFASSDSVMVEIQQRDDSKLASNTYIISFTAVIFVALLLMISGKVFVRQLNHGTATTSFSNPSNVGFGSCQTNRLTTEYENPETGGYYSVDTIPLKNITEATVDPQIAESNVLFITKIKQGDIRQRWLGTLESESGVNKRTHITTRGQKSSYAVVEEWNHFIRNVGYLTPHENIVSLLGFCRKMGIDYCLQEDLCNGTVREYIEKHYGQDYLYGNAMEPIPSCFYRFGRDLICGVQFLHLHGWIHPGISAAKLLLNNTSTGCKLYDFCGLTVAEERIANEIRKNGPIPFLSLAPEVFLQTIYTPKSDIWSVGVALWEIFSYGAWPPSHEDVSCMKDVVPKLMRPWNCSEILYATLTQCWEFNQEARTTLSSLKTCLEVNIRDEWPKTTKSIEMNVEDSMKTLPFSNIHMEHAMYERHIEVSPRN